jgi:cytochrome P450
MSDGVVWKSLRKNMSPTFTSGKLKGMLEPISGVVDKFLEHVEKNATKGDDVEVKPLFQGKS